MTPTSCLGARGLAGAGAKDSSERAAPAGRAIDSPPTVASIGAAGSPTGDHFLPTGNSAEGFRFSGRAPPSAESLLTDALAATAPAPAAAGRSTVLPRIQMGPDGGGPTLVTEDKPRYRELGSLGEGGLGEVRLAVDEDIGRSVAIKRPHDGHELQRSSESARSAAARAAGSALDASRSSSAWRSDTALLRGRSGFHQ